MDEHEVFVVIVGDDPEIPESVKGHDFILELNDQNCLNDNDTYEIPNNCNIKKEPDYFEYELICKNLSTTNDSHLGLIKVENSSNCSNSDTESNDADLIDIKEESILPNCESVDEEKEHSDDFHKVKYLHTGHKISTATNNEDTQPGQIETEVRGSQQNKRALKKSMSEYYSFVDELRSNYPELNEDEDLLISVLANIMREIKPPPPPEGFCVEIGPSFTCTLCEKLTTSSGAAKRHYQENHGPRYLQCFACGFTYRSVSTFYKHEKHCLAKDANVVLKARALIVGEYGRPGKNRPFLDEKKRKRERKEALRQREMERRKKSSLHKWPCGTCTQTFSTQRTRDAHARKHAGLRPFRCDHCPAAYASRTSFRRHVETNHSSTIFICDTCNKKFKQRGNLISHLAVHLPKFKYLCAECGHHYTKRKDLEAHVSVKHLNQAKPYPCNLCPKSFSRFSGLNVHMKNKHGMKIMTQRSLFQKLPFLSEEEVRNATVAFDPGAKVPPPQPS